MCFSKTPKIVQAPDPQPLAPDVTPIFGGSDEGLKASKKNRKKLGSKQLQIPLGGSTSIGNRAGLGIPKG